MVFKKNITTQIRSFAKRYSSYGIVIDQAIYAAFTFFFTSGFNKMLKTDEFVALNLNLSVIMIVLGYTRALINQPQAILYRNGRKYNLEVLYFALIIIVLFFTIFSVLINLIYSREQTPAFILAFPIFVFLIQALRDAFSVTRNYLKLTLLTITYLLGLLALIFSSSIVFSYYVMGLDVLYISILFYSLRKHINVLEEARKLVLSSWSFSRWIVISNTIFLITSSSLPFLLQEIHGDIMVSKYFIFMSLLGVFNPVMRGLYLKKMNVNDSRIRISMRVIYISVIIVPIGMLSTYSLSYIFYPEDHFLRGFYLLISFGLIILLRSLYFIVDINFNISKRNRSLTLVSLVRLLPVFYITLSENIALEGFASAMILAGLIELIILYSIDAEKVAFNL